MTAEQSLIGAMGLASWRVRYHLREFAYVAPRGGKLGVKGKKLASNTPEIDGLNEVGLTDSVMARVWGAGPSTAAYSVTSKAESGHLGADIAIIHKKRILLYQAKIASLDGQILVFKSPVTSKQVELLTSSKVVKIKEPDGTKPEYSVTSRLAIYQADSVPYLGCCGRARRVTHEILMRGMWGHQGRLVFSSSDVDTLRAEDGTPNYGRVYYEEVLQRPCDNGQTCSPSGVLAWSFAANSSDASDDKKNQEVLSVQVSDATPWEFYTYRWLISQSDQSSSDSPGEAPTFEPYAVGGTGATAADDLADNLKDQLEIPEETKLFVIKI